MNTLGFMLVAAILHLFNVDEVTTDGLNELTGRKFTTSIYWLTFLVIGLFFDVLYTLAGLFS